MIINIKPDPEKADSILNLVKTRKSFVEQRSGQGFPSIIAENYYEIIKSLLQQSFL